MTEIEKLYNLRTRIYYKIKMHYEMKISDPELEELEEKWMELTKKIFNLENPIPQRNKYTGVP